MLVGCGGWCWSAILVGIVVVVGGGGGLLVEGVSFYSDLLDSCRFIAQAKSEEGKGASSVKHRAYNFAVASRKIVAICGGGSLPQHTSITTLLPYGGRSVASLLRRPRLVNRSAVFNELRVRALTYAKAFEPGAPSTGQWIW